MGNASYGKGFHDGLARGRAEGLASGRNQGTWMNIAGAVATVVTIIGVSAFENRKRRRTMPVAPDAADE